MRSVLFSPMSLVVLMLLAWVVWHHALRTRGRYAGRRAERESWVQFLENLFTAILLLAVLVVGLWALASSPRGVKPFFQLRGDGTAPWRQVSP